MREIKFRGKRVDNGEWIYGDLMTYDNDYVICDIDDGGYLPIVRETVGQFTGLKDKNGKEIYEGDILDCQDRIVLIEWNNPCAGWDSNFIRYINKLCSNGIAPTEWKYRAEVIGNIHDNPELLEVSNA